MNVIKSIFFASAMIAVASCSGDKQNTATQTPEQEPINESATAPEKDNALFTAIVESVDGLDSTQPVVVDFNATWCGPCKRFAPIFEKGKEDYAGRVQFVEIDIDENQALAEMFGINSIPTVAYLDANGSIDIVNGLMSQDEFYAMLDRNLE